MPSLQPELFEPSSDITESQWSWALSTLAEITEELNHEEAKERRIITGLIEWRRLVKLYYNFEIQMHRVERIDPKVLENHHTMVSGLMAFGGHIKSLFESLPPDSKESVAQFVPLEVVSTLMKNLKESYELWHVEVSSSLTKQIQTALGVAD